LSGALRVALRVYVVHTLWVTSILVLVPVDAGVDEAEHVIGIIFVNILLDKGIVTSETFTALLLMAIGSTMLSTPVVYPKLRRLAGLVWKAG
jgi:hypothetical protein